MKIKEERNLKEQTKKLSVKEGIACSLMDGAGGKYISPYALALGANNTQIGLLTSLPSLLGNFSQLLTSRAMKKFERKKIIIGGVFLQTLMWIPILFLGYLFFYKNLNHGFSATLLIIFYTALVIFGSFASPAWNSLMRDIVSKNFGTYFSRRNKIICLMAIITTIICGIVLDYFKKADLLFFGFAILFGVAFFARLTSTFLFLKHYDPPFKMKEKYFFSLRDFIKKMPSNNFGRFTMFISLVVFATSIASPFFSVYMLKELNFSYTIWMIVIVTNTISTCIFLPLWGKFADKFGNLRVIKWTGMITPLVPFLWCATFFIAKTNMFLLVGYLILLELLSGFAWAGFDLSARNFVYDAVSREKLSLCIAYYSILQGVGVFLGATLGGILSSFDFSFLNASSFLLIFLLSGLMRFAVYFIMISKINEVRKVKKYEDGEFKKEMKEMFFPSHLGMHSVRGLFSYRHHFTHK